MTPAGSPPEPPAVDVDTQTDADWPWSFVGGHPSPTHFMRNPIAAPLRFFFQAS